MRCVRKRPQSGVLARGMRVTLVVLLCLSACVPISPDIKSYLTVARVVDLTHVIRGDMPHLPGRPMTYFKQRVGVSDTYVTRMGLSNGTSLLLVAGGHAIQPSVAHVLPADLVIPAVVLDMRDHAQDNADYRLSIQDIVAWECRYGQIVPGTLVLLVTGWDMRWGSHRDYLNLHQGQIRVPGFGEAAIEWLVQHRGVRGVGVDAPGSHLAVALSDLNQTTTGGTYHLILEHLTNLEQVPPVGATLAIGVLKVEASAVAPARVVALIP